MVRSKPKMSVKKRSTKAPVRSTATTRKLAENKRKEAVRGHRRFDVTGIIFLALSAFSVVALASPNSGVFGSAMRDTFSTLFGRGSWISPVVFALMGVTYLKGETQRRSWMMVSGIVLLTLAVLGFLAKSVNGDFFDPATAQNSGGYLGAASAAMFAMLLGNGKAIGLITTGLIGSVMVLDKPIRHMISEWRLNQASPEEYQVLEDETKPGKIKKAVIVTGEEEPLNRSLPKGFVSDEPTAPTKKPTIFRDSNEMKPAAKLPTLSIESSVPKEGYQLPPLSMLTEAVAKPPRPAQEMQKNIETIEGTLEQFGIDANVVEVATGPTITRYEIQLGPGIRVARIVALADNIAMDMAASQVRVEAPIPGKAAIGLEIPNVKSFTVNIRELVETKEFLDHPSRLCVALGKDVAGVNRYADLTKMPHLLIAGATNSGKSIGLATLITSLLMRNTPKDLRLVMIDPKRVELTLFDQIPHLMCPVIKDVKEAPGVLRAIIREMDRRYDLLSEGGCRNIDGWNEKASFQDKMPYIVVIIDELADLMIQAKAEVETSIVRLAQLARAVGIHLVIATQRPSVDVITGTIKANIPSRIAFAVASQIDSRTILDTKGAEALIGRGDMLFQPIDATKPIRVQGCYVNEKEIDSICKFWREQESPNYAFDPAEFEAVDPVKASGNFGENVDPMWEDAVRFVAERGQASTSMVQRRFSIGFQRASRLLDQMEERGIIGPRDGAKPREILIGLSEVEALFSGGIPAPTYEMGTSIDDWEEAP
jgi:DNA segregation ATPase FtsK/SpoIIIE, S-DNA-T family